MLKTLLFRSFSAAPFPPHKELILKQIKSNPLLIYIKSTDPYCMQAMSAFKEINVSPAVIELDKEAEGDSLANALKEITKQNTLPSIFIQGKHIGGFIDLKEGLESGKFQELLRRAKIHYGKVE